MVTGKICRSKNHIAVTWGFRTKIELMGSLTGAQYMIGQGRKLQGNIYKMEVKRLMNECDEEGLNVFLENQSQLFEEAVAETLEDAEKHLYGVTAWAVVVENIDDGKRIPGRRRNGYSGNV